MEKFFIIFWAAMILGSIAWYGFLVFYVGIKAGRDIRQMIKTLKAGQPGPDRPPV
jgi:hypothetical protein